MNPMVSRSLASLGMIAALVGIAHADTVTYAYSGAAVPITDNSPAGVNVDIAVADTFSLSQFTSVSLSFAPAHTWAGDVIATLTHVPSGRTITLFRRIGVNSASTVGDSSDLGGTYTFSNILAVTGATRLIDAADAAGATAVIANGVYRPTTNSLVGSGTSAFSGETITNLNTTFDGLSSVSGTWRLNVSDSAGLDSGTLSGFSFTVVTPPVVVPETSSLVLSVFGATVSGMVVIRRKRKPLSA